MALLAVTSGRTPANGSVKVDCHEMQASPAFFKSVIQHVLAGSWRHSDNEWGALGKGACTSCPIGGLHAVTASFRSAAADLDPASAKLKV